MTKRGTTISTENLGGDVLILVKNGLTYTSLSSLDPSSDYLAITVKIKGASPIHLFNLLPALLPPTLSQNPSHLSSYHHPPLLTSLATLTAIIHPRTPTHRKTNQKRSVRLAPFFSSDTHQQPRTSYSTTSCHRKPLLP